MGRYSTVQAYADNNANMRAVSYEQATGSSEVKKGAVKAEKVSNPYGSTAGAGSGEFHVYRHARSREMERWNRIDQKEKFDQEEKAFLDKQHEAEEESLSKTEKNRRKRQRQKEAKMRKKNLQLSGVAAVIVAEGDSQKKTAPNNEQQQQNGRVDDEEFTYKPVAQQQQQDDDNDKKLPASDAVTEAAIPNDGSFLEMMKQKLAAENTEDDGMEPPKKRQATWKTKDLHHHWVCEMNK